MEFRFFEIYRNTEYINLLLAGMTTTFLLTVLAGTIGFCLAILLAGVRYEKMNYIASISASYTEFIRNTPLIVQLFFVAAQFFRNISATARLMHLITFSASLATPPELSKIMGWYIQDLQVTMTTPLTSRI